MTEVSVFYNMLKTIGNEWRLGEHHRIYINDLWRFIGLEVDRYKTGNIKKASLNGVSISNGKASKICAQMNQAKVWYDINAKKWGSKGLSVEQLEEIIKNIHEHIGESIA